MDPLSALSVASSVIEYVDFAFKLMSGSRELYNSADGSSSVNSDLEFIAKDLTEICSRLSQNGSYIPDKMASKPEPALLQMSQSSEKLAQKFSSVLQSLKVGTRHKRRRSIRQALRSVLRQKQIATYEERLKKYRSQIAFQLTNILRWVLTFRKPSIY